MYTRNPVQKNIASMYTCAPCIRHKQLPMSGTRRTKGNVAYAALVVISALASASANASDGYAQGIAQKPDAISLQMNHLHDRTCFGARIPDTGDGLSRSSVALKAVTKEARTIALGTGTIIRDSADHANPHNRILTAYHVTRVIPLPKLEGLTIEVVGSDGTPLGTAVVSARAAKTPDFPHPKLVANAYASLGNQDVADVDVSSDMAVLEMTAGPPGGWPAYDEREGIALASRQGRHMLTSLFSSPGGLEHGASGAGVIDDTDGLIGVVVASLSDDGLNTSRPYRRMVPAQNVLLRNGDTTMIGYSGSGALLAPIARGYMLPVMDRGILAALNGAGRTVHVDPSSAPGVSRGVRIAAYPQANCIYYHGIVEEWNASDRHMIANMTDMEFQAWLRSDPDN